MPLAFNQNGYKIMAVLKNLQQENEILRAQLAAVQAAQASSLRLKVSAKGGVSLYGMGRWPTTLYRSQWETLLAHSDAIKSFIREHASQLSEKGDRE
jgi:hypothetical protein